MYVNDIQNFVANLFLPILFSSQQLINHVIIYCDIFIILISDGEYSDFGS